MLTGKAVMCMLVVGLVLCNAGEPSIRPLGLQLVWEKSAEQFDGFATFNTQKATTLALLLDGGGKSLIEVDQDNSEVETFKDDQGKDLKGEVGSFPKVSKDGKLARVSVEGEEAVTPGAKTVTAKGVVKARTASKRETKKSKLVEVKNGEKAVLGDKLQFKIVKSGKPDWGDEPFMIELEVKRDIPEVAELRFYDEAGKLIKSKQSGSSRMGFMKMVTVSRDYSLARKVDKIVVEADLWTDMEIVEVPFEITVGVGGK